MSAMNIYSPTTNYRRIYEKHYGPRSKDQNGRPMEIHHIDGNRNNNDISNLKLVTIQEHYDIHYSQGDWAACLLIASKMKLNPEEMSRLAIQHSQKRVSNGTHNFLGGEIQRVTNKKRIDEGTHNFLGNMNPNIKRLNEGTHNLLGPKTNRKRLDNGTHHFLNGKATQQRQLNRVKEGNHPFLGNNINQKMLAEGKHSSQIKVTCEHCGKIVTRNTIGQHIRRFHK
jgi:hypothetical protein